MATQYNTSVRIHRLYNNLKKNRKELQIKYSELANEIEIINSPHYRKKEIITKDYEKKIKMLDENYNHELNVLLAKLKLTNIQINSSIITPQQKDKIKKDIKKITTDMSKISLENIKKKEEYNILYNRQIKDIKNQMIIKTEKIDNELKLISIKLDNIQVNIQQISPQLNAFDLELMNRIKDHNILKDNTECRICLNTCCLMVNLNLPCTRSNRMFRPTCASSRVCIKCVKDYTKNGIKNDHLKCLNCNSSYYDNSEDDIEDDECYINFRNCYVIDYRILDSYISAEQTKIKKITGYEYELEFIDCPECYCHRKFSSFHELYKHIIDNHSILLRRLS